MSKEYLESLEKVYYGSQGYGDCDENYKIVKQALERLEAIDNAKPSEALECLENLFSNVVSTTYNRESSLKDFNVIKQALLKAQEPKQYVDELKLVEKSLKALEIIKEKNVDIRWIEVCDTVKDYNKGRDEHLNYELTEEEFNLLKEVLE